MQEQEFRKLMEKSIEGSLMENEGNLLNEFHDKLKKKTRQSYFTDENHKIELKESIWKEVGKSAVPKNKVWTWRKVASIAASFIGILSISYIMWQQFNSDSTSIPENAITLELEDGTIKVISEDGAASVMDKQGKIVGTQNKNQLIYSKGSGIKELVYNTLTVPYGKTFELLLSDGTKAHLNAGSSLKYPVQFLDRMERKVYITGEVFLSVEKDSLHPFIVNAYDLNVRVLGTSFNVNAYPEDDVTEIVLVEGSVGLYNDSEKFDPEKSELLSPGYKASFDKKTMEISKKAVITDLYTSWMNGELVFRNMSFANILKKLERHYDVNIINNNLNLSQEKFNANFGGGSPLSDVLEELKENYNISYKVENTTVTIN